MDIQEDSITESFGGYIKFKRENKGLRLKEVAEKAEISTAYLSKLENSKRKKPSIPMIKKLAYGLEVSVIDLLQIYLKINEPETKSIRAVILEGNYIINGKEVPKEIRILISDILELIFNNEWQEENKYDILREDLVRKVKNLNDIFQDNKYSRIY